MPRGPWRDDWPDVLTTAVNISGLHYSVTVSARTKHVCILWSHLDRSILVDCFVVIVVGRRSSVVVRYCCWSSSVVVGFCRLSSIFVGCCLRLFATVVSSTFKVFHGQLTCVIDVVIIISTRQLMLPKALEHRNNLTNNSDLPNVIAKFHIIHI